MRWTAVILALLSALLSSADDRWGYLPSTAFDANAPISVPLSDGAAMRWIEARVAPTSKPQPSDSWAIQWTGTDSLSYAARLGWGKPDADPILWRRHLTVSVIRGDSTIATIDDIPDEVANAKAPCTLALELGDNDCLRLWLGSAQLSPLLDLTAIGSPRSCTTITASSPSQLVEARWRISQSPITQPPILTDAQIIERIIGSDDPMESLWEYYDHISTASSALPGGRYRLATIADDDGGYYLLLLDGAKVNPHLWPSGSVKGRLIPTIYTDTWRLHWIDADGVAMTDRHELTATIDNGALLSLNFPELAATIRLTRVPRSRLRHN